jgi:hypothetical protein
MIIHPMIMMYSIEFVALNVDDGGYLVPLDDIPSDKRTIFIRRLFFGSKRI